MSNKKNGRFTDFLRNNALYVVIAMCILAIGLSVSLMLISEQSEKLPDVANLEQPVNDGSVDGGADVIDAGGGEQTDVPPPVTPVTDEEISFIMPVDGDIITEYTTTVYFNSTLNRYSKHLGIDIAAAEGADVYAAYGGVIESVSSSLLTGVTVRIDHGDGLYTVYNSIADTDALTVGQRVERGDVIGTVSLNNRQEYKDGPHLHFEVIENGETINPEKYLLSENK